MKAWTCSDCKEVETTEAPMSVGEWGSRILCHECVEDRLESDLDDSYNPGEDEW